MKNEDIARGILELSGAEKIVHTIADSLPFQTRGGPPIAEVMRNHGVLLTQGDTRSRVTGWQQLISRFYGIEVPGYGLVPMIYCFDTCRDSIRTIPQLPHDDHKPEDIPDSGHEDHCADEWRLACMSRPWYRPKVEPKLTRSLEDATYAEILAATDRGQRQRYKPPARLRL
jgi:hypothetical protein